MLMNNVFEPYQTPAGMGNPHFCPETGFTSSYLPNGGALSCTEIDPWGLVGSSGAYQQAADQERASNFAPASVAFATLIPRYPQSEEALWATRASLRTGLRAGLAASSLHDSLQNLWAESSVPMDLRHSARREAVWALVAGQNYFAANNELQSIMADPNPEDSLWAAVMTEIISLIQSGGPQVQSVGPQAMHQRLNAFHDRLNKLMGRATDEEVLNSKQQPVVQTDKLCRAYPNPFNNTVNIAFDLPKDAQVRLDIFNLLGQKVGTLVNEPLKAGTHTYSWSGDTHSSGVYFYRFQSASHVETQKLMLLK
jgi:hypothetical protein